MIDIKDPSVSTELQEVVRRVVARFHPDQILLYGSFAYGTPHEESDFDLLVILPDPPAGKDGWAAAHEIEVNRMLQLVFMKPALFEEEKDVVGGLAYPAHHWGKWLYSLSPGSTGLPPSEPPPRTREQVIWDFIQGWIKKAGNSLKFMELMQKNGPNDYFYSGYYSQMAAENYIRSFLVWRQVPYRKTRIIRELLGLFPEGDASLAQELSGSDWLSPFGVDFPDPASPPVDPETGRKAVAEAKRVQSLILERLGSYLAKGRPGLPGGQAS
jgi:predicted nucleotidyltransferase